MAKREEDFQKAMSEGHSAAWDQEWEKAAAAYQKALNEFPYHPKALSSLGLAYYELQRYEDSLQAYQKAVEAAPDDPMPLEKVGQLSERLGNIKEAIAAFMHAAELYVKTQDTEKALENWVRVTQLDSDHVVARSYLAMVHERLGHTPQATAEYLAVASLYQRSGNGAKAADMVGRALRLRPNNPEVRQAELMLKSGQLLPKPMRPQGGTGPLRMAQIKKLEAPKNDDTGLDPIAEARKKALTRLAEVLFDLSEEAGSNAVSKHGMQAIVRGTGQLNLKQSERSKIMLHIGQAIDAQTKEQDEQAAEELDKALAAGFTDPSLYYDLGFLRSKADRSEVAMRHLQVAVKAEDYALGSRLLMGDIQRKQERLADAVVDYMEALKIADSLVVPAEEAAEIRQLYEPLIEAQAHETDTKKLEQLCDNINQLLLRPNWRSQVTQAREQLPKSGEGMPSMPLAEIMTQAQSGQVIEAVTKVRQLARAGHLRSAMDEAFESFKYAPTYLPLHALVGDLLIQEGRTQDAIAKYTVVAQAYSVRGEAAQAVNLLRRIVQVSPMDLAARTRLIDQLAARGLVDEAIAEYLDLADIYYRLAELDMARKTYTTALRLAQQGGANRAWSVKLLQRMADIDMQHLDWRQALRVFEQLRTLEPDELSIRKNLIDLNIRLGQITQAVDELNNILTYLDSVNRRGEIIPLLEEMVNDSPQQILLRKALAEEYRRANRLTDAVGQLDALGENLLNAGDRKGATEAIEAIIAMNPPNQEDYQKLLAKIVAGE
ncbi:MAG TPA: tetratricopeptide repeat protein [Anaerolineales bacterium]|nr:tetratricopeptide repeat protein [Anaerolineales bacterium]